MKFSPDTIWTSSGTDHSDQWTYPAEQQQGISTARAESVANDVNLQDGVRFKACTSLNRVLYFTPTLQITLRVAPINVQKSECKTAAFTTGFKISNKFTQLSHFCNRMFNSHYVHISNALLEA